eukprot:COSAG03_NODE_1511_length_3952_cov_10.484817_10_plen_81_part_00
MSVSVLLPLWDHADTVEVDLSSAGLKPGQPYRVQDSQNFYGDPVLSGVYTPTAVYTAGERRESGGGRAAGERRRRRSRCR